jgi:hypothetical protein
LSAEADDTDLELARTRRRQRRLMLAAAATLAATVWAALQPEESAAPPSRPRTGADPGAVSAPRSGAALGSATRPAAAVPGWPEPPDAGRRQPWRAALAHGVAAWSGAPDTPPAPAPALAVARTAPAQAPAFPYTLIGRLDDGEALALLSGPLRSFGVKAAEVIDGEWRVDSVQATGLTLTWLPGGVTKTVVLGQP